MIDRVAATPPAARRVPVGFKWFVKGLTEGTLAFAPGKKALVHRCFGVTEGFGRRIKMVSCSDFWPGK